MTVSFLFRKKNPVFFSIEKVFSTVAEEMEQQSVRVTKFFAPEKGVSIRNILSARTHFRRNRADICHITGDATYVALGLSRRNMVLTIHDVGFLHQAKGVKRWVLKKMLLDWPVNHCKVVTAISDATKTDILRHTHCDPSKIVVIPNPIDNAIQWNPHVFREECPVILFIGVTPNKNLDRVISALEGIPCSLHVIGKIPPDSRRVLEEKGIAFKQEVNLTDKELANAYASADLVLFPSLFEGFGLPIVEGQKTGRVVVTSDLNPMNEVAGGAACLVDPHSVESIRSGVMKVIHDHKYREGLIAAGRKNVERFEASFIATQYIACYRQLLAHTDNKPY